MFPGAGPINPPFVCPQAKDPFGRPLQRFTTRLDDRALHGQSGCAKLRADNEIAPERP